MSTDTAPDLTATPWGLGRRIALVLVGPAVWSTHLLVAYLGGAVHCRAGSSAGAGHPFIWVTTAVAAVILVATIVVAGRRLARTDDTEAFVAGLAVGIAVMSLAGVLVEGVWAAVTPC